MYDFVNNELCCDYFSASEIQFGFKGNNSTTMCTVILREVVYNYVDGYSNVYCCLLDASEALNKFLEHGVKNIHYIIYRMVSFLVIRLLITVMLDKHGFLGTVLDPSILYCKMN